MEQGVESGLGYVKPLTLDGLDGSHSRHLFDESPLMFEGRRPQFQRFWFLRADVRLTDGAAGGCEQDPFHVLRVYCCPDVPGQDQMSGTLRRRRGGYQQSRSADCAWTSASIRTDDQGVMPTRRPAQTRGASAACLPFLQAFSFLAGSSSEATIEPATRAKTTPRETAIGIL